MHATTLFRAKHDRPMHLLCKCCPPSAMHGALKSRLLSFAVREEPRPNWRGLPGAVHHQAAAGLHHRKGRAPVHKAVRLHLFVIKNFQDDTCTCL